MVDPGASSEEIRKEIFEEFSTRLSNREIDEEGREQTLTRDADSRDLEPPEEDLSPPLQQTIDTARQKQHILTRADLRDLIIAQPKSRRQVLSKLLDLPEVDERRLILKRTRDTLRKNGRMRKPPDRQFLSA